MSIAYRYLKKLLCASALLMFGIGTATAQSYPSKPIKFILGFSAGGPTDIVARVVANHVSKKLGQPVIVENHTGANGMLAAAEVARAEPDGYTVHITASSTLTLNPLTYSKKTIQYKAEDFAPVALMVQYPFVLLINPDNERTAGVSTLEDLIKLARSKPNHLTYGSSGLGGLVHLLFERLNDIAGIKITHAPYRGSAAAQLGLLRKEVDVEGDNPSAVGLVKAGKLKAIAVTLPERWRELPDVPAVDELPGFKGYDMSSWVAAVVPARTPPAIVKILSDAISSSVDDPATKAVLAKVGNVPMLNPQQFAAKIKAETEVNAEIIKRANIQLVD